MRCPKCGSATRQVYGRQLPQEVSVYERRRRCSAETCGYAFTTHEGTAKLAAARTSIKPRKSGKPKLSPDEAIARLTRAKKIYLLREMAREEAWETGRPYEQVLAEWNVPLTPFKAEQTASPHP